MSDRKYGQRGYQEDERSSRSSHPRSPRPDRDGPRGRGLGGTGRAAFRCPSCGTVRPAVDPIEAETVCDGCGAALRTCKGCRHFDAALPNECREPVAERVARKTEANRCDHFEVKLVQTIGGKDSGGTSADDAKSAFDALFDL